MSQTENDLLFHLLFIMGTAFFAFIVFFGFMKKLIEFREELRYLNGEIGRTQGKEQKCWIRKRRKLWLSILPFVRY